MRLPKRILLIVSAVLLLVFTQCDDAPEPYANHPIVGLWEEMVNPFNWDDPEFAGNCEGADATFVGWWTFESDGEYDLEFGAGTIAGGVNGYSRGTYQLLSDSLLIISAKQYENLSYAFLGVKDTIIIELNDTRFTSSVGLTPHISCKRYWIKLK